MTENDSCPVDLKTVDKNLIRANAFIVFSMILIYILTNNYIFIFIILIDFALKVFFGVKYSPIGRTIKYLLRKAGTKIQLIDAWPKVFAAKIGLILAILITICHFSDLTFPALIFALIFLIASGLEAFFNYCLACFIYPYYKKLLRHK